MGKNVSEVLLEVLTDAGVRFIFTIPGGAINSIIEALRKQDKIKIIYVRHEETGALAASAIGKLTGKLGVCMGTSGPGAIHLLNGLYDAMHDHSPVLSICGGAETKDQGIEYMQDINLEQLFSDVAAYNEEIKNPSQLPKVVEEACRSALHHRTVSNLIIPADVAIEDVPDADNRTSYFEGNEKRLPDENEIVKAVDLINNSKKIVILAGYGAKDSAASLLKFAELLKAQIIKALRGKDLLPDIHPYVLGGIGRLGTRPSIHAIDKCDLLIMVGTDFPYDEFYPKDTPVIQIDIDPKQIGKRVPVKAGIAGDADLAIEELLKKCNPKDDEEFLKDMQKEVKDWFEEQSKKEKSEDVPIHPQAVADAVGRAADDNAVFCCDTGNVTVWAARNLKIRGNQLFTISGGMATMGYGLPAAIGAQLMFPGRQIIALCGDGGFTMLMADFMTAVQYELPIVVVIFNNNKLGMIQMEQEEMGYPEFAVEFPNPDFTLFARACGGEGMKVTHPNELDGAIQTALGSPMPFILDVVVDPNEIPMPPKIEFAQAVRYSKAKVKEFLGK